MGALHRFARRLALLGIPVALAMTAVPASAAFPGANGRIAFTACGDDGCQVATMASDGSDVNLLAGGSVPAWSPDGRQIAYGDCRSRPFCQVYVMNADGSGDHRVTHLNGDALDPSWSPDGARLVFENAPAHGTCCSQLWSINADGTGLRRITNFHSEVSPREPEFSPDGRWIAFYEASVGGGDLAAIFLVGAAGSGLHQVTPLDLDAGHPDWAPDGSRIAFNNLYHQPVGDIFTIRPDGTGLVQLTNVSVDGMADFRPSYSPDGTQIAYNHGEGGPDTIWVMSAAGNGQHEIYADLFGFAPDWGAQP